MGCTLIRDVRVAAGVRTIGTPRLRGCPPGARRILPFRGAWQPIVLAGFRRQPSRIGLGVIPGGAGDRVRSGLLEAGIFPVVFCPIAPVAVVCLAALHVPAGCCDEFPKFIHRNGVRRQRDRMGDHHPMQRLFKRRGIFSRCRSLFESTGGQNRQDGTASGSRGSSCPAGSRAPLRPRVCSARAPDDAQRARSRRAARSQRRSISLAASCGNSSANRGSSTAEPAAAARLYCAACAPRLRTSIGGRTSTVGGASPRGNIWAALDSRCWAAACHCAARLASLRTDAPNFSISALLSRSFACKPATWVRKLSRSAFAAVARLCAACSFSSVF